MVIDRVKKLFDDCGADALVVREDDLRFYLTGFSSSFGVVVADDEGVSFYTDSRYLEAAEKCLTPLGFKVLEYPRGIKLTSLLSKYKKLAMPLGRITASDYLALTECGYAIVDSLSLFERSMAGKDEGEIKSIKKACVATDRAYEELLGEIKEGMTENEVAALLEYLMRKHGASGTSFSTICAFGANASVPHHETGNTKLKFGDPILLDFGCKVEGYCSDCTRTLLFGDDGRHGEFKDIYAKVLDAHFLVKEKFAAGMSGKQGDAIARDYFAKFGLDKYFTHALGHSLGINIHESPSLSPSCESIFTDGMVFSDEPGLYIAGKLGVRIEDTVTLKEGKVVSLTDSDKNLYII